MQIESVVICALTASAVLAHEHHGFHHHHHHHRDLSDTPQGCGFQAPDVHSIEEMAVAQQERLSRAQYEQERRSNSKNRLFRCNPWGDIDDEDFGPENGGFVNITTYIHAIQKDNDTGFLSDEILQENIDITNQLLLSTGFQLNVVATNRVVDKIWYDSEWNTFEQKNMEKKHRKGNLKTLNVYYKAARMFGGRYCGYANLAENAKAMGKGDGIVVDTDCATDKTTLAHEVGHWLNLLHTFDGGCSPGDLVDDTNAQSWYYGRIIGACPNPLPDSCPDRPGADPLDNIMDYAPLGCDDVFTEGQARRMREAWRNIRSRS
ncbi:hypothetical protein FisN_9Hh025 [Fistulifera solaris]|uniref:Peptidase M43 pregnancy-associated plasma-A domain-containing protein n=1 Tax=Fistulifera solaris TaxID=1519565 RepID=A0A1Z5K216_FISSO|nr:hypothetical protein FisN_9Hh025 [Fistulifera solaris]|eukprot:GAX20317.1 hypothetical protein FisN_9Hh025 [Fistulifera solaris]